MTLLAVENLSVCYGDLYAVREVSFALQQDSVFVLLGANGAGKTSILRSISGLVPARGGSILADGKSLIGLPPHQVARAGISHVPEGRRIFTHLTVEENLTVSFLADRAPVKLAQAFAAIYQLFPRLAERRRQAGGTLSGGEQQMLAIGRALMANPRLLLIDEASLGLSPAISPFSPALRVIFMAFLRYRAWITFPDRRGGRNPSLPACRGRPPAPPGRSPE